jgi:hypothetical protein
MSHKGEESNATFTKNGHYSNIEPEFVWQFPNSIIAWTRKNGTKKNGSTSYRSNGEKILFSRKKIGLEG